MDTSLSERRDLVIDMEAWYAAIHGVAKNRTRLNNRTEQNSWNCLYTYSYLLYLNEGLQGDPTSPF